MGSGAAGDAQGRRMRAKLVQGLPGVGSQVAQQVRVAAEAATALRA